MRDAPPQQIRTECFWRFGPEQLAVSFPQVRNRSCRQTIQFRFNRWIDRFRERGLLNGHYRPLADFAAVFAHFDFDLLVAFCPSPRSTTASRAATDTTPPIQGGAIEEEKPAS